MNIQDYTTEELRAELGRRKREKLRKAAEERKRQGVQYAYARAVITGRYGGRLRNRTYEAKIIPEDLEKMDTQAQFQHARGREYPLLKANFNTATEPNVGDTVLLRSRKTKDNPDGFGLFCMAYIVEVIKRKGE